MFTKLSFKFANTNHSLNTSLSDHNVYTYTNQPTNQPRPLQNHPEQQYICMSLVQKQHNLRSFLSSVKITALIVVPIFRLHYVNYVYYVYRVNCTCVRVGLMCEARCYTAILCTYVDYTVLAVPCTALNVPVQE